MDEIQVIDKLNIVFIMVDDMNDWGIWEYPAITIHGQGNVAIRSQNWRYIRYYDGGEELYDHRTDPNEWYNLATKEEHTDIIKEHLKWAPESFAEPIGGKGEWFFDPYEYTWLHRESGEFIDGNK